MTYINIVNYFKGTLYMMVIGKNCNKHVKDSEVYKNSIYLFKNLKFTGYLKKLNISSLFLFYTSHVAIQQYCFYHRCHQTS